METSGSTPPGALTARDQPAGLARIARSDGPFARVYLGVPPDAVDAAHRLDIGWRDARRELEALARGRVEVLVVHDDPDDNRTAWFGPEPLHVGARRDVVEAMGVASPREGRLVDALLRAALGSGAGIRIVADSRRLDGRVGAILRWTD